MFAYFRNYLRDLESALFYRYLLITLGLCVALSAGLLYWHQHTMSNLAQLAESINTIREQVRDILTKDERANRQHRQVKILLEKEPGFRILKQFDTWKEKFGLKGALKENPDIVSVEREGEHTEVVLTAKLFAISMEQLVKLLEAIEDYERVYPKSIDITKSKRTPTIDVTLVIATLRSRT